MYKNGRYSTIKFIKDNVTTLAGQYGYPLNYIDWDARFEIQNLPETDHIGIAGYGLTDDDQFDNLIFGVTVATRQDENLFRITDYVDHFYKAMQPTEGFSLYRVEDAQIIGKVVFKNGVSATPVRQAEKFNMITILGDAYLLVDPTI